MFDGATLLRRFINRHGVTQFAASQALGVSDPTVNDWLKGVKRPVAHHRDAIAIWTNGEVPVESWVRNSERDAVARVRPFVPVERESGALPSDTAKSTGTD
jgi:transcriptional regulator with XRE-family HTH domain